MQQEHISQFDDHFVLKHLKPFEEVPLEFMNLKLGVHAAVL